MKLTMSSTITLSNGVQMPMLGYSTERHAYNEKTQTDILLDAIEAGYRYFETSLEYGSVVTRALGKAIRMSGIPREEFFVSARNRIEELSQRTICDAFNESLDEFGFDYFDLYSISWPYFSSFVRAWVGAEPGERVHGYPYGLQDFYKMGLTRAIGVCNFNIDHLEAIRQHPRTEIMPMIDQSHFHPEFTCESLRRYCGEHKIAFGGLFLDDHTRKPTRSVIFTDAWTSGEYFETTDERKAANNDEFGQVSDDNKFHRMTRCHATEGYMKNPFDPANNPRLQRFYYDHSSPVCEIGKEYGKTAQQVVTRWSLQHGVVTLVKGMSVEEMRDGADVYDFELTPEQMQRMDALNVDRRIGYNPDFIDF